MAAERIEVHLQSITLSSHLAEFKDSYDFHYEWAIHYRDTYHWLRDQGFTKGRILEPNSAAVLPALESALEYLSDRIAVYDLNTFSGRMRGWLAGIRRAPCVRFDGRKHTGAMAAAAALRRAVETSSQP